MSKRHKRTNKNGTATATVTVTATATATATATDTGGVMNCFCGRRMVRGDPGHKNHRNDHLVPGED